jgi:hypothetical protein
LAGWLGNGKVGWLAGWLGKGVVGWQGAGKMFDFDIHSKLYLHSMNTP